MPHPYRPYTEEQLVELPAFELFGTLDWDTVSALEETFGSDSTVSQLTTLSVENPTD